MKSVEESVALAQEMVSIGEHAGRKTVALITDMDVPLGYAVGNSLEVIEAVDTLRGQGPEDLTEVCKKLAANMVCLAGRGTLKECGRMVDEAIESGRALERLTAMVEAQGGDSSVIKDTDLFLKAPYTHEVKAKESGYMVSMDTESCGIASSMLGAGRETKDSTIDFSAGIVLKKKVGDLVKAGDTLAVMYASEKERFQTAEERYQRAVKIGDRKPEVKPRIYARVSKEGVESY